MDALLSVVGRFSPVSLSRAFHALAGGRSQSATEPAPAEPAAAPSGTASKGSLEQARAAFGEDVATGFDTFSGSIAYLQPRALDHGFALNIKTATGSAKPEFRALESGPQGDAETRDKRTSTAS